MPNHNLYSSPDEIILSLLLGLFFVLSIGVLTLLVALIVYFIKRKKKWSYGKALLATYRRTFIFNMFAAAIGALAVTLLYADNWQLYFRPLY